jgi:hypothetical protein
MGVQPSDILQQEAANCQTAINCKAYHNSEETTLTSMFDLHSRAYIYNMSIFSFIQMGLEENGFVRNLPYSHTSYGNPTQCYVADISNMCHNKFVNSKCGSGAYSEYPPYDARVRIITIVDNEHELILSLFCSVASGINCLNNRKPPRMRHISRSRDRAVGVCL